MAQPLLTIGTVSRTAGLARQTIYNWCRAGLIEPSFRVEETAVFTPAERDRIAALAKERAATRAKLRLAPNGNGAPPVAEIQSPSPFEVA